MKQAYINGRLGADRQRLVDFMNDICADYEQQGYRLTVRQLYYQLVARDLVPNSEASYNSVQSAINKARLLGLMDWDIIEDRTRDFTSRPHWVSGGDILRTCADQFYMDMWENQDHRVFAVVEKEALVGVLEPTCRAYDVPLLAARGYPSVSVLYEFATERLLHDHQDMVILHLGDHDPSGIDMTRDLTERLELFGCVFELHRLALNMEQVRQQKPPPNPAKITDSRCADYRRKYGDYSWELDALSPQYLTSLLENSITTYIDDERWAEREKQIEETKSRLFKIAKEF